eukprot:6204644-Pleurochrysis_carterae.AAC.2
MSHIGDFSKLSTRRRGGALAKALADQPSHTHTDQLRHGCPVRLSDAPTPRRSPRVVCEGNPVPLPPLHSTFAARAPARASATHPPHAPVCAEPLGAVAKVRRLVLGLAHLPRVNLLHHAPALRRARLGLDHAQLAVDDVHLRCEGRGQSAGTWRKGVRYLGMRCVGCGALGDSGANKISDVEWWKSKSEKTVRSKSGEN